MSWTRLSHLRVTGLTPGQSTKTLSATWLRLVGFKSRSIFFRVLKPGSPRSGFSRFWVLVRSLFLACRWCPCFILTWSFIQTVEFYTLKGLLWMCCLSPSAPQKFISGMSKHDKWSFHADTTSEVLLLCYLPALSDGLSMICQGTLGHDSASGTPQKQLFEKHLDFLSHLLPFFLCHESIPELAF